MFYFEIPFGRIGIALAKAQQSRLYSTCFRGRKVCEAGNFNRWHSFDGLMSDREHMPMLLDVVNDMLLSRKERPITPFREQFTVQFPGAIGWSSTIPIDHVSSHLFQRRALNKQSEAMFVTDRNFLAPLTRLMSLTAYFKPDGEGRLAAVIMLDTLYPGPGVGRLVGDMTAATGQAWLDFHHPGGDQLLEFDL